MHRSTRPSLGTFLYLALLLGLAAYFAFAAVQGDYGIFRRAEIDADAAQLRVQLQAVQQDVTRMENLTRRLSDDYLDLDLLDERSRRVLGVVRADEIVIR